MSNLKNRSLYIPFILTAAVVLLDQVTKIAVAALVRPYTVGFSLFGDFFRIIHVYNPGIAFSIGGDLPQTIRSFVFGLLPLAGIAFVLALYFRTNTFTRLQRWCIAGIVGGGIGNLIDRFFRPEGVLDFLDVKFYGLFGLERWPTFNVADSAIVVCGIIMVIAVILQTRSESKSAVSVSDKEA